MAQILCFARNTRNLAALSGAICSAGHNPIRCRSMAAALRRARTTPLAAMVVEYCRGTQHFRNFLKDVKHRRDIPVVVVSRQVVNAFRLAGSLADLYLEEPVRQAELADFVNLLAAVDGLLPAAKPAATNTPTAVTGNVPVRKLPARPAAPELKPAAAAAH